MTSLFSSWLSSPAPAPPKTAVVIGEGCSPGTAPRGTTLFIIEREIRDKLEAEPEFDRLREMKAYIEGMDFLKKEGTTVDVFFVDECMKSYRPRGPGSVISAASRTTGASDIGSVSPSTRRTTSSATDSNTTTELQRHQIPFQLMTTNQRWRQILASKTTSGNQNFISSRVAGQSGYSMEAGVRINTMMKLGNTPEEIDCALQIRDMEQDVILCEAFVVKFAAYQADYQLNDYWNVSTEQSSSTATGWAQDPRNRHLSSARSHQGGSIAGTSSSSIRNVNEDADREYEVLMNLAESITERDRIRRAERRLS